MPRALLFDLHGTLAYLQNRVNERTASKLLLQHGLPVYPQTLEAAWKYVGMVDYPREGYAGWHDYLEKVLVRTGVRPRSSAIEDLETLYLRQKWKLFPDSRRALKKAKQAGLKTAIVTTIAKFMFKELLQDTGDQFDIVVDGHTFRREKSDPKIYARTIASLGVKPRETFMVGDDVLTDVQTANDAGLRPLLLVREGEAPAGSNEAYAVVRTLGEAVRKASAGMPAPIPEKTTTSRRDSRPRHQPG